MSGFDAPRQQLETLAEISPVFIKDREVQSVRLQSAAIAIPFFAVFFVVTSICVFRRCA